MNKPQLFLLHFAGGSIFSFQFTQDLAKDFEVIPLELPGRGKRFKENLLTSFDDAAIDIFNQIIASEKLDDFFIYGHSMGALLALRVANLLEKQERFPKCLILSGNPGPGISENKNRFLMDDENFIVELKKLGGIPEDLYHQTEMLSLFLPILRADFEIAEKHSLATEKPTKSAIFAIMGDLEDQFEKISNWKNFTSSYFNFQILSGGHFFIHEHVKIISSIIRDAYYGFNSTF